MMFNRCFVTLLTLLPLHGQAKTHVEFPSRYFQCDNTLKYNVYFAGIKTGWLTRIERWGANGGQISSNSYAGILGIGTRFKQQSEFDWVEDQGFITRHFTQQVNGFKNRRMDVTTSEQGRKSVMVINQQEMRFDNPERAILDIDTISAQLRYHLLNQQHQFKLTRQASDMLEHYDYQVGKPTVKAISPWGELTLTPVVQEGADNVTMWFAAELDYQLVEAEYHSMLLPGSMKLKDYQRQCPDQTNH